MTEQVDLITLGLGERLRIARIEQGIELQAAASATRLPENTLSIIENEDWDRLPGVYRAGWARNYANFLGVSLEKCDEDIKSLSVQGLPKLQSVFSEGIKINKMDTNLRVLSYAVMSIFIVLPLIWAYTKTAANLSQPNVISVVGPTSNNRGNTSSLPIPKQAARNESANVIPQHMEANAVPTGSLGSKNADSMVGNSKGGPADNTVSTDNTVTANYQVLDVRLKADSWVVVTDAAGRRLEYDLLRGGNSYSYSGNAPFDILIGRASAVELSINGREVDLGPYESGNVASLQLDVMADPEN